MQELIFLKLGGSLITDKIQPYTVRKDKLADLATQIAHALRTTPDLLLVLGHGSGSFGHTAAKQHRTREGVYSTEGWRGFCEVWYQASELNRYVIKALHEVGLPAITFSPAASAWSKDGHVSTWDLSPLQTALQNGIIPVVHGDVIFDKTIGGTILSTEELFEYLAKELHPQRILLAGLEAGVWADFPVRGKKVDILTRESLNGIGEGVGKAIGDDVTGGMESKVREMLNLVASIDGLSIQIFSGEEPGNLEKALLGAHLGTLIKP